MNSVTIVDFGIGNLFSVGKAFEKCGCDQIIIANTESQITKADRLVLPGVGAFSNGMKGLAGIKCIEPIFEYVKSGNPLLGICLGMQMLGTKSYEFGVHKGLNLIPGKVLKIPTRDENGFSRKVPIVGWSELQLKNFGSSKLNIMRNTEDGSAVYFVHSYQFVTESEIDTVAYYEANNLKITAAIQYENIIGLQFHPEKSSHVGLSILKNFIKL